MCRSWDIHLLMPTALKLFQVYLTKTKQEKHEKKNREKLQQTTEKHIHKSGIIMWMSDKRIGSYCIKYENGGFRDVKIWILVNIYYLAAVSKLLYFFYHGIIFDSLHRRNMSSRRIIKKKNGLGIQMVTCISLDLILSNDWIR